MSDFCNDLHLVHSEYIHGDVSQDRRERIIRDFNNGNLKIIFATDVASRGLDFKDINVVVNVDFPVDVENYVHRIGRCGRNGAKGLAFTFVTSEIFSSEQKHRKLVNIVTQSGNNVPSLLRI